MGRDEGSKAYVSPQERAGGILNSLSRLPAAQTPREATIAQLHSLQKHPDFVSIVRALYKGIKFPRDRTAPVDPEVSTLVEELLYPRGAADPKEDPIVAGMKDTIKTALEDTRYEGMYVRLRSASITVGKFVQRWEEIEPTEVDEDPDQVAQTASHLRSIRYDLVRLSKLDELAKGTARRRTATVLHYKHPKIQDWEKLQLSGAHEERALEGLNDHRDPLMTDLNNRIRALAEVHPNTIADALLQVLTEEEKEKVEAKRKALLEAKNLTMSAPDTTDSKDQSFRDWTAGINNVGIRLIKAGEFIGDLHDVERTIIDWGTIRFKGRVDTERLDDIIEAAALVTVFGKKVPQNQKNKDI